MEKKEAKVCDKCKKSFKSVIIIKNNRKNTYNECECGITNDKGKLIK